MKDQILLVRGPECDIEVIRDMMKSDWNFKFDPVILEAASLEELIVSVTVILHDLNAKVKAHTEARDKVEEIHNKLNSLI